MSREYLYKWIGAAINFFVMVAMGFIVPKAIGPEQYGIYGYLSSLYVFLFQVLSLNFNTAYVFFRSKKTYGELGLNSVFVVFAFSVVGLSLFGSAIVARRGDLSLIFFPGVQGNSYVFLGAFFSSLAYLQARSFDVADCCSRVSASEMARGFSRIFALLVIFFLFLFDDLSLEGYYYTLIFSMVLYFIIFLRVVPLQMSVGVGEGLCILKSFWRYSYPLWVMAMAAAMYTFLGRYVLQAHAGPRGQGIYSFAYQVATMPVAFVSSLSPILLRDMTRCVQADEGDELQKIFLNSLSICFVGVFSFAIFVRSEGGEFVVMLMGADFIPALPVLHTLLVFAVFHVFGILASNVYFCFDKTRSFARFNIGVVFLGLITFLSILLFAEMDALFLSKVVTLFYVFRVSEQFRRALKMLKLSLLRIVMYLLALAIPVIVLAFSVNVLDVMSVRVSLYLAMIMFYCSLLWYKDKIMILAKLY